MNVWINIGDSIYDDLIAAMLSSILLFKIWSILISQYDPVHNSYIMDNIKIPLGSQYIDDACLDWEWYPVINIVSILRRWYDECEVVCYFNYSFVSSVCCWCLLSGLYTWCDSICDEMSFSGLLAL